MHICLSSAARPRYRQDIIRAVAIPSGGKVSFRYDRKWISPSVLQKIEEKALVEQPALICFVDQQDTSRQPILVPCRFAEFGEIDRPGSTVSLQLVLGDFAYAEDLEAFNRQIRASSGDLVPTCDAKGDISGTYWFEVSQQITTAVKTTELADWEQLVTQLAEFPDFGIDREPFFFYVKGLYRATDREPVKMKSGAYNLSPGAEYEIQIYHFHPKSSPVQASTWLRLDADSSAVRLPAGNLAAVDSRYDLKRIRVMTDTAVFKEEGGIHIYRVDGNPQADPAVDEFRLAFKVRGALPTTVCKGLLLGALLASPHVLSIDDFANLNAYVPAVFPLIAGILVAFGVRKRADLIG